MFRLRKKCASHGIWERDMALCYIDGEILTGENHPIIIKEFLANKQEIGIKILHDYFEKYPESYDLEEQEEIYDEFELNGTMPSRILSQYSEFKRVKGIFNSLNDLPLAFAHIVNREKAIYVESKSLQNVDINTVANAIKALYPEFNIYDDDSAEINDLSSDYKKIASKIALFRKAIHDASNRDFALCYIDGEVLAGDVHPKVIQDFLKNRKQSGKKIILDFFETHPDTFKWIQKQEILNNFEQNGEVPYEIAMQYAEFDRKEQKYNSLDNLPIAFGHICMDQKAVFIEKNSMQNVDMDTVAQAVSVEFPGYGIYNDDSYSPSGGKTISYEKVARLVKKSEYVHCHNCKFDNGDFMYDDDGNLLSWVPGKDTKKFKILKEQQIYKNYKEFNEKNPDKICPICGKHELDID